MMLEFEFIACSCKCSMECCVHCS